MVTSACVTNSGVSSTASSQPVWVRERVMWSDHLLLPLRGPSKRRHRARDGGGRELKLHLGDAGAGCGGAEAEPREQLDRGAVLGKYARGEPADAVLPRALDQACRELAADAAALPLVDDLEGDLGDVVAVCADGVAGDADDRAVARVDRGDRLASDVVEI